MSNIERTSAALLDIKNKVDEHERRVKQLELNSREDELQATRIWDQITELQTKVGILNALPPSDEPSTHLPVVTDRRMVELYNSFAYNIGIPTLHNLDTEAGSKRINGLRAALKDGGLIR